MAGLVQAGRVQVFVLVLELLLSPALFLGWLAGVRRPGGRFGVGVLIHRDLL
ncbi:hypothetical protein MOKP45_30310 [Mycobacterium avium subsp. hominissuis]|uniref:Uncharacterized protein n=1 Tax=Mycobacterium avium subsp. hominissuis TaxID=439334 RepID=A0AAI8SHZ8_MYCAV|nr:hypothetical protein MAH_0135 [Mycobacterium avium subsp. hominissuis TH135]BBN45639.1 hypothetical protein JPH1_01140 [Mycobacterium avium subsp. hominissuis]